MSVFSLAVCPRAEACDYGKGVATASAPFVGLLTLSNVVTHCHSH